MWRGHGRARVLIADGDEDALTRAALRLGRAGYEVLVARDGAEALARARAEQPDVCVIDAVTPKLSGYDVSRRLRADERTSEVAVLLMTVRWPTPGERNADVDGYLRKPCSAHELRERVDALLRTPRAAAARRGPS
jgi:DNA-binding response OmpR family regulator